MKNNPILLIVATVSVAAIFSQPAGGQDLAAEKMRAEINKIEADTEKVRIDAAKAQSDALASFKSSTTGSATVTAPETSAEGLLLTHHVYSGAAARLASKAAAWQNKPGQKPLVVIGSSPPSVAEWLAFREGRSRLLQNLATANKDWKDANAPGPKRARPSGGAKAMVMAAPAIMPIISAVTSVVSLFRTDTTIAGSALTTTDAQLDVILAAALRSNDFDVDVTTFAVPGAPVHIEGEMRALEALYRIAHGYYHDGYLPQLKLAKEPAKLPNQAIALAGAHLATVIADYEAVRKALYTPVNGVLPATLLERQRTIFEANGTRPIIYVRNNKAALSTVTKKNFFTGFGKVPAFLTAAAVLDYTLIGGAAAHPVFGSVSCIIPNVRITDVAALERTRPVPKRWVGRLPSDAERTRRANTQDGICERDPMSVTVDRGMPAMLTSAVQ